MPTSSGFQLLQVPPSLSSWPSGLYGFASNAGADDGPCATARSARSDGQRPQACETLADDPDAAGDATRLIRSSQVVEYVRSSLERYNAEHPGSSTRIRTW